MPTFKRKSTQPMRPESYKSAARKLRGMADKLESYANAQTPRERASRTRILGVIVTYAKHIWVRNWRATEL